MAHCTEKGNSFPEPTSSTNSDSAANTDVLAVGIKLWKHLQHIPGSHQRCQSKGCFLRRGPILSHAQEGPEPGELRGFIPAEPCPGSWLALGWERQRDPGHAASAAAGSGPAPAAPSARALSPPRCRAPGGHRGGGGGSVPCRPREELQATVGDTSASKARSQGRKGMEKQHLAPPGPELFVSPRRERPQLPGTE